MVDEECSRRAASHVLAVNVDGQSANGEMRRLLIEVRREKARVLATGVYRVGKVRSLAGGSIKLSYKSVDRVADRVSVAPTR